MNIRWILVLMVLLAFVATHSLAAGDHFSSINGRVYKNETPRAPLPLREPNFNPLPGVLVVPTAYPTIQLAIDAALDGDTVLVLEGTYYEQIRFKGKAITVASQLLIDGDTSHVRNTIIDGSQLTDPDSLSVVYFIDGEDTTSVLMGFTVQGGRGTVHTYADGTDGRTGGGIDIWGSSAKLLNNIITDNTINDYAVFGTTGAGVQIGASLVPVPLPWLVMEGNTVTNNHVVGSVGGGVGVNVFYANGRIAHNVITYNTADAIEASAAGGLSLELTGDVQVLFNEISNNQIHAVGSSGYGQFAFGGAVDITDGDFLYSGTKVLIGNLFASNSAVCDYGNAAGGAVWINWVPNLLFARNRVEDNTVNGSTRSAGGGLSVANLTGRVENNIFVRNAALRGIAAGGGVRVALGTSLEIVNNTIVDNTTDYNGGGLTVEDGASAYTFNNIFWGNTAPTSDGGPQIKRWPGGILYVRYSNVEGGWTGEGNMDLDPLFIDDTFVLTEASSCIGMGRDSVSINSVWRYAPGDDFLGNSRPSPAGEQPSDMGAMEELFTVDVETATGLPERYLLHQNYPNPFNPGTTISYQLPARSEVTLKVFDLLGKEVATLVNGQEEAGYRSVTFDGSNLTSGIYFYRLQAGSFVETKKLILMK